MSEARARVATKHKPLGETMTHDHIQTLTIRELLALADELGVPAVTLLIEAEPQP
jgi:hypothetical protein